MRGRFSPRPARAGSRPRHLEPSTDRALEAICSKAMAEAPEDRYATPRALADDVERLDGRRTGDRLSRSLAHEGPSLASPASDRRDRNQLPPRSR